MAENMKIIPTKSRIMANLKSGVKNGGIGGLGVLIGQALLGKGLGTMVGGILAGSMLGGDDGKIISSVAGMMGVSELLNASASSSSVSAGVM